MKDTLFLFIKTEVETDHQNIHEAIHELQTEATHFIGSTKRVKVISTAIIELNTKKNRV